MYLQYTIANLCIFEALWGLSLGAIYACFIIISSIYIYIINNLIVTQQYLYKPSA